MTALPDAERRPLPLGLGVQFSHATVQAIADRERIEVLHIKGPVVDATLRGAAGGDGSAVAQASPRHSVDADVMVHPRQARQLIAAMTRSGWELAWEFDEGSLFAHAATIRHPHLPHVDVHRSFPGIEREPGAAFEILLEGARRIPLAEFPCQIPSETAHRLILLLHAARGSGRADVSAVWTSATPAQRAEVRDLARRLDAEVALAAAIEELDTMRDRRSHRLWQALQQPSPSHRETLVGHLYAARPSEVPALLIRFLLLNKRRMERESGESVGARATIAGYRTWVAQRIRGGR